MSHFPVPTNDRDISYTAVGTETDFDTDYPVFDENDFQVIRTRSATTTTLTITTDYTVSIDVDTGIATVTPVGSIVAADTWRLKGNMVAARTSDYQQRGGWQADQINEDFDRVWMALQEFVRDLAAAQVAPQTLPLSLLNGGTGASYASAAALRTGLGLVGLAEVRGYIAGLTLSNNATDATNDIDIAVGAANASDQSAVLVLGSALTKRLDAAWAVGTNQGGLDTGSIADTTYHVWLIRRPDTGVVDVLFSASASSPTMPADYTQKRRIGSIIRASSAIVAFRQNGDRFMRNVPVRNVNTADPGTTAILSTLSIPVGLTLEALLYVEGIDVSLAAATFILVTSPDQTDTVPTGAICNIKIVGGASAFGSTQMQIKTNTSAQVRYRLDNSTADHTVNIYTLGWVDARGRFD